jgi:hypothetical protein
VRSRDLTLQVDEQRTCTERDRSDIRLGITPSLSRPFMSRNLAARMYNSLKGNTMKFSSKMLVDMICQYVMMTLNALSVVM